MEPHTHISAVHAITFLAFVIAVIGTMHLIAIRNPDSRVARAIIALGF